MEISSYKDLIIWQKGIDLAVNVYSLAKNFPDDEKFALSNQVKRCASSIPANIAEGYGRQSSKTLRFQEALYLNLKHIYYLQKS